MRGPERNGPTMEPMFFVFVTGRLPSPFHLSPTSSRTSHLTSRLGATSPHLPSLLTHSGAALQSAACPPSPPPLSNLLSSHHRPPLSSPSLIIQQQRTHEWSSRRLTWGIWSGWVEGAGGQMNHKDGGIKNFPTAPLQGCRNLPPASAEAPSVRLLPLFFPCC